MTWCANLIGFISDDCEFHWDLVLKHDLGGSSDGGIDNELKYENWELFISFHLCQAGALSVFILFELCITSTKMTGIYYKEKLMNEWVRSEEWVVELYGGDCRRKENVFVEFQ